jgi:hypothetical protein
MHPMLWFVLLAPPCLSLIIWNVIGQDFQAGNTPPWQRLRPFKGGFWVTLCVLYVGMFATAIALHRL